MHSSDPGGRPLGFVLTFSDGRTLYHTGDTWIFGDMALIQEHGGERHAFSQMKKHLAWYTEGLAHATDCRARIFQTRSPAEVWEVFQEYWEASTLAPAVV